MRNRTIWEPRDPSGNLRTTMVCNKCHRMPCSGTWDPFGLQWPETAVFVDKPRGNPCLGTPKPHFGEEVLRNCPIWEPWEPWEPVGNRLGTSGRRFFATSIRESPVWEPWDPFRLLKFYLGDPNPRLDPAGPPPPALYQAPWA